MTDPADSGESIYGELRRRVFDLEPPRVGLADERLPGGVWGVLFELGLERVTVTVIALADGTTSLYTSDGFGIIGGEAHPAVVVANRKLREAVAARLDAFRPDARRRSPGPEDLKVRALTGTGRRRGRRRSAGRPARGHASAV